MTVMTVGGTSLACGRGTSRPPWSLARATAGRTSCRRGSWLARGHETSRARGRGWRRLSAAGLTAPWMETTARQRRPRSGSHTVGSCPGHRDGATLKPQPPHPSLRSSGGNYSDGHGPAGGIMSDDDGACGASSPRSPTCGASACSGQTPLFGSTPACSGTPRAPSSARSTGTTRPSRSRPRRRRGRPSSTGQGESGQPCQLITIIVDSHVSF